MSNAGKAAIICTTLACGALLFIHRRVIAAAITGDPMPEPPEWHKKYFKCCDFEDSDKEKEFEVEYEYDDTDEDEA